jgi:hypothetical protein
MYRKALAADKIAYFDTATTVLMMLAASAAGLLTLALSVIATESSSLGGVSVLGIATTSSSSLAKLYIDPDERSIGDPNEIVLSI